jgi:hypothetical protein
MLDSVKIWWQLVKMAVLKLFGQNKMDFGDLFRPFKSPQGNILAERYFHAFSRRGLKHLVKAQGFSVESAGLVRRNQQRNIQIIAKSPRD